MTKINYYYIKSLSKNKTLEAQFAIFNMLSIGFQLAYTKKCDHGGLYLNITVFGLYLSLQIADNRHWNTRNKKYD